MPEAVREYADAVVWYGDIDGELAERFVRSLEERLALAMRMRGAGRLEPSAPDRFELRWYSLRDFPYALLIGTAAEERVVVAVAHEHRRPGYWADRLETLDSGES